MYRATTVSTAFTAITTAFVLAASAAQGDGMVTYSSVDSFDDTVFALENAIIGQGLVVDHVSHVGEMLERTREDVGSDVVLFEAADVLSFCSATLSRKVMEADPTNIRFCPYDIFVSQMSGSDEVTVGYRTMPAGPMQEVETLLDQLAREAAGAD
ncbi:DUF302 domain-containing protein [Aliiroseovarius sp. PTFE2010]|uniref:DUF302 domain-containing protein n=1 Tax=Aliiroseovarius sp. PTFE2010 TaxID=3417190 RepID=UPI003CED9753